ncbi:glycoside hydrolase superfamily [Cyathus striatus]|nr:glycoside hydrolase superfamily [Cyathus striatus]
MFERSPACLIYLGLLSTVLCSILELGFAFSLDRSDNLAVYWGQDAANHQQSLSFYCQDDTIDIIPIAFLYDFFGKGGMPVIDLSNSRTRRYVEHVSGQRKISYLSLGGAESSVGFTSDDQAKSFAQTIWNTFLGGNSGTRPFGSAVLDGVDLDIESGSPSHYGTFVNELRSLSDNADKQYYVTAAPQCPFPDAKVGAALNSAPFDAVFVQFYNNYCETSTPSEFNFDTWDKWARTQSANPNVKVYLGAPASSKAAGSGFVSSDTLINVARDAQNKYSSFGGIMLWDADTAYTNGRFDRAVKDAIRNGPIGTTAKTSRPSTATFQKTSVSTPTPTHTVPTTTSDQASVPTPIPTSTSVKSQQRPSGTPELPPE